MSHLHIPDGILPWWLILGGWVALLTLVGLALPAVRRFDRLLRLPRLSFFAAVMLLAMSIEILPLAYHVNLSVLTGIVLGPSIGFLAVVVVVTMLAFVGHGGITVIGLNALVLGLETVLGSWLYSRFARLGLPRPWAAAFATIVALATSTTLMVGIVWAGGSPVLAQSEHGGGGFRSFLAVVYGAGSLGWLIEAFVTARLIRYFSAVRPALLAPV